MHLWFLGLAQPEAPVFLAALSPDERSAWDALQGRAHAQEQRRHLAGRMLARLALSRHFAVPPTQWSFAPDGYGKPWVVQPWWARPHLAFNLSHSSGVAVLAVTAGARVGVDVENIAARPAPLHVAARFFSPAEVRQLHACEPVEQPGQFYRCWTAKEAYVKALGRGLSIPLERFSVRPREDGSVDLRNAPGDTARWHLRQLQPRPDWMVSVCVEDTGAGPLQVFTHKLA